MCWAKWGLILESQPVLTVSSWLNVATVKLGLDTVKQILASVKMSWYRGSMVEAAGKGAYHHGNLPDSLLAAAAELIAEKGPSGFSLREVARRAGVSHAAPAHHFGDTEGLMTSLATEGYRTLADAMEESVASTDDPAQSLLAAGRAYVNTALENPGHFAVMIGKQQVCDDNEEFLAESARAYEVLQAIITNIRDQLNQDLDIDAACTFCWASIQGLVQLSGLLDKVADDMGTSKASLDESVESFANLMIRGLARRAHAPKD